MRYLDGFACVNNETGLIEAERKYPYLVGFEYTDGTGLRGEFLLQDFHVRYRPEGSKVVYDMTIKGNVRPCFENSFDFDGASCPSVLRILFYDKLAHQVRVAALFHDMGYCVHDVLPDMNKAFYDRMFYDMCLVYGADVTKAANGYAAIRSAGFVFWSKTEEEIKRYRNLFIVETSLV